MPEIDLSRAKWHKSSFSSQDGNCVEVARNVPGLVAVRDSKDPTGTTLTFPSAAWQTFLLTPVEVGSAELPVAAVRAEGFADRSFS